MATAKVKELLSSKQTFRLAANCFESSFSHGSARRVLPPLGSSTLRFEELVPAQHGIFKSAPVSSQQTSQARNSPPTWHESSMSSHMELGCTSWHKCATLSHVKGQSGNTRTLPGPWLLARSRFSSSSGGPEVSGAVPAEDVSVGMDQGAQLLPPERCKSLLVANWRAQLTTFNASSTKGNEDKMTSSLAQVSFHDGSPVIWIPPSESHAVNLVMDERGSILVGGTDPPALVHALRRVGKTPARAVLVGDLLAAEPSEAPYLRRLLETQLSSLGSAAQAAGLVAAKGEMATSPEDEKALALAPAVALPPSVESLAKNFIPFRLACRTCQLISVQGERTKLEYKEVSTAAADPLALASVGLLDSINRTNSLRRAMVLFCAAYMGVQLGEEGAYMIALDRWGFNVLAACSTEGANNSVWREFRFSFQSEVSGAESFLRALQNMEQEAVGQGGIQDSGNP